MIAERAVFDPMNQQAIYRRLLDATGYPGRVCPVGEWCGADPAWAAALATLADNAVTLHDLDGLLDAELRGLMETPDAPAASASFILARGERVPSAGLRPSLGTLNRPEFGATIVLAVGELVPGEAEGGLTLELRGPGIRTVTVLGVRGLHAGWIEARGGWCRAFPLGVDLLLCDRVSVASLPRTTLVGSVGVGTASGSGRSC